MKKNSRPGSAILIVVLVMSALLFFCFNLFQSTVLTVDVVLKRQEREQKARIAQGILNYGITLCTSRFEQFEKKAKNKKESWDFSVGTWKLEDFGGYGGHLNVAWKDDALHLTATLLEEADACAFGTGCVVERKMKQDEEKEKQYFVVRDWTEYV